MNKKFATIILLSTSLLYVGCGSKSAEVKEDRPLNSPNQVESSSDNSTLEDDSKEESKENLKEDTSSETEETTETEENEKPETLDKEDSSTEAPPETESKPEAKPETPSKPQAKPEAPTKPVAKPEAPTKPETKPQAPTKPETKPETPSKPETKPETPSKPVTKPETPSKPVAKPETPSKPVAKPETPTTPETKPEASHLSASAIFNQITEGLSFPNLMDVDATLLTDLYGIDASLIEDYCAKMPLMSAHITEIGVFKVKNEADIPTIVSNIKNRAANVGQMLYPSLQEAFDNRVLITKGNYILFAMDEQSKAIENKFNALIK